MSNRLAAAFLAGLFISGCAAPDGFVKLDRPWLRLAVPIYIGAPPPEWRCRSLGSVEGSYRSGLLQDFFGETVSAENVALRDMAENARAMGANAVVRLDMEPRWEGSYRVYRGEAVVFDAVPR